MPEGKELPGFTREMLTGDVREVADELQGKVSGFFKDRGLGSASQLNQELQSGRLSSVDIAPMRENIRMLQQIIRRTISRQR